MYAPDDQLNMTPEEIAQHILNENNRLIGKEFVEELLEKYGLKHKVRNLEQFQRGMVHRSYLRKVVHSDKTLKIIKDVDKINDPTKAIPLQEHSYERLEFLGDSVIHLAIAQYLFKRYPDEDEGFMTKLRTRFENGEALSQITKKMGLNEYAVIARNIEQMSGRYNNTSILEDIFEAFIGALYLETSFEVCKQFVINIIEKEIDITNLIYYETNYKDKLMQHFHTMKWKDPLYEHADTDETTGKRKFVMTVKRRETGELLGRGTGTSKKKGEKIAAQVALKKLGVEQIDTDTDTDDLYGEVAMD